MFIKKTYACVLLKIKYFCPRRLELYLYKNLIHLDKIIILLLLLLNPNEFNQ